MSDKVLHAGLAPIYSGPGSQHVPPGRFAGQQTHGYNEPVVVGVHGVELGPLPRKVVGEIIPPTLLGRDGRTHRLLRSVGFDLVDAQSAVLRLEARKVGPPKVSPGAPIGSQPAPGPPWRI